MYTVVYLPGTIYISIYIYKDRYRTVPMVRYGMVGMVRYGISGMVGMVRFDKSEARRPKTGQTCPRPGQARS